tara:strand:+ start:588 stop:1802 length:1215 start_codon:yes stop_codon:yes gene_type:complete
MNAAVALPEALRKFEGRIMDLDSHEMIPLQEWEAVYGPEVKPMFDAWFVKGETDENDKNSPNVPGYPGDIVPIGADITTLKGCRAPGARDAGRRVEVMDAMGVGKQLIFSSYVGIFSLMMLMNPGDTEFLSVIKDDRQGLAGTLLDKYHDWVVSVGKISDRLRPVAPMFAETPALLVEKARKLIDNGIRAIQIPAGNLPGNVSPAHPDLDPFWKLLTDSKCALVLHIGCEGQFFETRDWANAPAFENFRNLGEFNTDPWSLSILHLPFQNFVSTMISGGVFERHPELKIGVIEVGAHWVGPMMEALDMWYVNSQAFKTPNNYRLPELPSFYVKNNLRVTPYVFEPVDTYIERYGLEDVLCFSSDYPHIEGGRNMLDTFYKKLERLGPEIVEKFFVTNGSVLLPD